MLRIIQAALIGAAMLIAVPATAQDEVDPQALAAARALLQAVDLEAQISATTTQVTDRTIATIMEQFRAQHGRAFPPALEAELRQLLLAHNAAVLAAMAPTMLDDSARIYARHFTTEEIVELARIQTNPVMLKARRIMPQLFAELSQIGMAATLERMPELRRQIDAAISRYIEAEERHGERPAT